MRRSKLKPIINEKVLNWFDEHGRKNLPWQQNPTSFSIWVSEIMLQQTQVSTVIPYYQRFMQAFPNVRQLASANVDNVLHYWSGLGYYARARNMHKAARLVCSEYGGKMPTDLNTLMLLPGIGRSTAGAILSLSGGDPHPILDGNVKRVLSRFYAVKGWPGKSATAKRLWTLAEHNTPKSHGADYTQGIMDLGATVCTRSRPLCGQCPLQRECLAHATGKEKEFPERRPKKIKEQKSTNMLLVRHGAKIYLERRPREGIWGGLYSFPEVASEDQIPIWIRTVFKSEVTSIKAVSVMRHSFTHFDLNIHPFLVSLNIEQAAISEELGSIWYKPGSMAKIGIPAPITDLIQTVTAE